MKRRLWLAATIVSALFLPVSCIPLLLAVNSVNPMQVMFLTTFTVENRLDREILITPIGTVGAAGHRRLLPLYRSRTPAIRASKRADLSIAPGETRTLIYDWDDINFSEILVRTPEWEKVLVVDPNPTDNQYHAPRQTDFVIDAAAPLAPPSPQILAAAADPGLSRLRVVSGVGIASLLIFFYARSRYRQLNRTAQPGVPSTS